MKHKFLSLLITIPLLTTIYLTDGSGVWVKDWYYWTKGPYPAIGIEFYIDSEKWSIPFYQIAKIVEN